MSNPMSNREVETEMVSGGLTEQEMRDASDFMDRFRAVGGTNESWAAYQREQVRLLSEESHRALEATRQTVERRSWRR